MAGERVRRLVMSLSANDGANAGKTARSILQHKEKSLNESNEENGLSYEDLWDCMNACMDRANATKASTRDLANALQQWQLAEKDYIKALPFTKKKYEVPPHETGTISDAVFEFCSSFPKLSNARSRLQSIVAAMAGQLHSFRKEQNLTKKKLESDGAKLRKGLVNQEATFLRTKAKYEKACKDAKELILQKEKAINSESRLQDVSKLWQRTTDAVIVVQESEKEYRNAVDEVNHARAQYKEQMKALMRELQLLEDSRAEYVKAMLHGIMDAYTDYNTVYQQTFTEVQEAVSKCDTSADLQSFVNEHIKPDPEEAVFQRHQDEKIDAELDSLVGVNSLQSTRKSSSKFMTVPHCNSDSSFSSDTEIQSPAPVAISSPAPVAISSPAPSETVYVAKNSPFKKISFVKALYMYNASDDSEISFRKGDLIEVLSKDESGWWEGRLADGATGSFPENYTVAVDEESHNSSDLLVDLAERRATAPITVNTIDQQIISPADTIQSPGMLESPTSADMSDYIESPFTSPVPTTNSYHSVKREDEEAYPVNGEDVSCICPLQPKFTRAKVLYNFQAQDASDLTIAKNEILTIHGMDHDGGWLDASNESGLRGMVPANYVKTLSDAVLSA